MELHVVTVTEFFFTAQGPMDRKVNVFYKNIKGGLTQLLYFVPVNNVY
jgi:hypothetical protein